MSSEKFRSLFLERFRALFNLGLEFSSLGLDLLKLFGGFDWFFNLGLLYGGLLSFAFRIRDILTGFQLFAILCFIGLIGTFLVTDRFRALNVGYRLQV